MKLRVAAEAGAEGEIDERGGGLALQRSAEPFDALCVAEVGDGLADLLGEDAAESRGAEAGLLGELVK